MEAVEDRYERLLDRLMDGGVIPLLGAGISLNARHCDGAEFRPSITWMKERLHDALKEILDKCRSYQKTTNDVRKNFKHQLLEDTLLTSPGDENSPFKPLDELSFDRLAELYCWLQRLGHGQMELCNLLKIQEFSNLIATEAHCYLAYLVREGLISEVLTTNYDNCLEKALKDSFSRQEQKSRKEPVCHVITTLEDYRLNGGRRWSHNNRPTPLPVLRLYKLNGCAVKYNDGKEKQSVQDSILLTERQLQSHKNNPWKRDLLRDRLRSYALLLCGFGNDEPQVRFLTLEIFNEFQNDDFQGKKYSEKAVWSLPNAPYINVYRNLSFPQLQVIEGFLNAHKLNIPHDSGPHGGNIFYGKDAQDLVGVDSNDNSEEQTRVVKVEEKLSADLFWKRLFQGAYQHLLRRYLRRGSSFYSWLDANSVYPQPWVSYMLDELYEADKIKGHPLFGRQLWREWLTLNHTEGALPLPWMRIVQSTMPASTALDKSSNWYLPLLEAPLTIPATLLVLILLNHHKGKRPDQYCTEGEGFRLSLTDEEQEHSLPIAIMQNTMADEAVSKTPFQVSRLSYRITIPDITGLSSEQRWSHVEKRQDDSTTMKRLKLGRERSVSLSRLIKRLGTPQQITRQRVIEVLKDSVWEDDEEHPVKQRLRPLRV